MPRVSKARKVSSKKKELFIDDFYSAITSFKDKYEVQSFFEDMLTTEEKLMLAKRFQVAMMLKLNYLWSEITDRVKVTTSTVAQVAQRIKRYKGGLLTVAQRIISFKEKKLNQWQKHKKEKYSDLGAEMVKAGLGILIQNKQRIRKKKSITS